MESASRFAVAYALNSLWQLPLLFLAAEMIARLLGRTRGKILCFVWWVAFVLALSVPALAFVSLPVRLLKTPVSTNSVTQQKPRSDPGPKASLRVFGDAC